MRGPEQPPLPVPASPDNDALRRLAGFVADELEGRAQGADDAGEQS